MLVLFIYIAYHRHTGGGKGIAMIYTGLGLFRMFFDVNSLIYV